MRILVIGHDVVPLGKALKADRPASLIAVELDASALEHARLQFDEVFAASDEGDGPEFPEGAFEGIACGDLLERVKRPERLLGRVRRWLAPEGRLWATFGNARCLGVVQGLLAGHWKGAEEAAIRRPIRFFTRREVEKLLSRAGFGTASFTVIPGAGHEDWVQRGRPGTIRVGNLHVGGLSPEEAEELFARGYLVEAAAAEASDCGTTSIVIVTHNQLDYTRQCVDSVRRLTDEPHELIFVDNGSTDATLDYLRTVPGAKVIANRENRGFAAAVNQGIAAGAGAQFLLLNNDTLVTTGWLRRLLGALHSDPRVGLAGPCANCVSGEQQIDVRYDDDLAGLDGFAWEWGKAHDRIREDTSRLVGFCLLIRRAVEEAIGVFDERFGIGCFEDDDYVLRAVNAGWRAVIARDACD